MGAPGARAQSNRADTASRTASNLSLTRAAQSTGNTSEYLSDAESDFGEQQAVSIRAGGLGAYLIGGSGLNYTSNPTLSSGGGKGDMYYFARGGAGIHPNLTGGLYLDGHISEEVFLYSRNTALNFSHLNAGGGLDYVFEDLGQLNLWVRYEYDRYLGGNLAEFFVNNSLVTGLGKEFLISDTMAIQTGAQAAISLTANPSSARRNEYDFWLGWRWRIVEPLELQTYYVVSLFYYPEGSRVDVTQNVGGSLNLSLTRWAKLSASVGFGTNSSTDSFYNYTVVNVGGTLGLDIRF